MAIEIERKFLVSSDDWRAGVESSLHFRQAYLASDSDVTVRVRTSRTSTSPDTMVEHAWLTLKGASDGLAKLEYEYPIPTDDAAEIMDKLTDSSVIEKTRHMLIHAGNEWVVDEFHAHNNGLLVAEIELNAENHRFDVPNWAGEEVTRDYRYSNKFLANHPWVDWPENAG